MYIKVGNSDRVCFFSKEKEDREVLRGNLEKRKHKEGAYKQIGECK